MAKYRVVSKGKLVTIKGRLSKKDKINERELSYLANSYASGLFKVSYDGKRNIAYTAPMSVSLEKYLKSRCMEEDIFWKIIAQILEIVKYVETKGLYANNLWMDLQTIYINESTGKTYFIYQPFVHTDNVSSALAVIKDILYREIKISAVERQIPAYLTAFQNFLAKADHYRLEQIEAYIARTYPKVFEILDRTELKGWVSPVEDDDPSKEEDTVCLEEETAILEDEEETTVLLEKTPRAVLNHQMDGERIQVEGREFYLGKGKDNHYCVRNNKAVSRRHAVIKRKDDDFYIADLKSTNGTFVNGRKLSDEEEAKLKDQDEIVLADEVFSIEIF